MKPERWQRIEQLYYSALERDAQQRAAFLAEACADDTALRSEVEGLLAANDSAEGFLGTPAVELEAKKLAAEPSEDSPGIQVGQELSHYKILKRIGAGGMGEVFLAHDSILERRVALKLLPVKFTQNAERLQRFIREAKAASALNHPNLITIYEIGEVVIAQGKTHFIATEYIEGTTLRAWTVDEEKRLHQAVNIAIQTASALDAAHKAGIVHRDIKPENVMVRPDGLVKVVDFGLAKLTSQPTPSVDSEAHTLTQGIQTLPGMILGTLRYMSPEQARGRNLDARSDIFSLGVMLYELLTEQPLFAGDTDADIIAAIIHKEAPPLAQYLPEVPAELERIVHKALAKDKELRYQNARDLQIDLQTLQQESELNARLARSGAVTRDQVAAQTSGLLTAPRFSFRHLLLVLPVLLLLIGAIWWLAAGRRTVVEAPPIESLPKTEVVRWASVPGETYSSGAFSLDGKWVAFTSSKSGTQNIWVRQTLSGDAKPSTQDKFINESPIWSPTGEEIAFFSMERDGQPGIWRKPMLGDTLMRLKALPAGEGDIRMLRWSKDGATIYYTSNRQLIALDVQSGETTQLTNFDLAQVKVLSESLSLSPDEKQLAYITREASNHYSLWVMAARNGSPRGIFNTSAEIRNTIWHRDGERIFYSANVAGTFQIFVADSKGRQPAQITSGEQDKFVVDVSSDGGKILYGSSEEQSDIWSVNLAKTEEPLASDINSELWPDVSPDNKIVAYQGVRNLSQGNKIYHCEILSKAVGGKAEPFVLAKDGFLPKWSPDGKQLAFMRQEKDSFSLNTVNVAGGEEKALVTGSLRDPDFHFLPYTRYEASVFSWAPVENRLAYFLKTDGAYNLRTVFADGSSDTQITDNKDANLIVYCPLWSADGKRIAYTTKPNKIATRQDNIYNFCVVDLGTKAAKSVAQMKPEIRLLGWSQSDQDLLFVRNERAQHKVGIWRVTVKTGEQSLITELSAANYYNIHLSPNRRSIAYVSPFDGKDNVWVIPVAGGVASKLTNNNDPQFYFSSLVWSPDNQTIFYGKQSRFSLLSMITNFK